MKNTLIFIAFLLIISVPSPAQKTRDALYLRNGSVIYGKLLEIADNNYRMEGSDKSLFIFPSSDVEKFVKETTAFSGRKSRGTGLSIEGGVLAGAQNNDLKAPFSFNILANYTVDVQNIVSLGTGVEFLNSTFTPLFFEYRRLMNEKRITPFIFLRGGALCHLGGNGDIDDSNQYNYREYYKGGASCGIGTGISWARDENETYLSFGYRYAQTSYRQTDYNHVTYTYKNSYNRLEIKFGFKF